MREPVRTMKRAADRPARLVGQSQDSPDQPCLGGSIDLHPSSIQGAPKTVIVERLQTII
jgi:hypothetical protein